MGGKPYWTTEKVKEGVLEVMKELNIDRMPSRAEIMGIMGGGIVQAIVRLGGSAAVADMLGIKSKYSRRAKKVYVYDENYNLLKEYPNSDALATNEGVTRYSVDCCTRDFKEYVSKEGKKYVYSFKKNLKREDRKIVPKRKYALNRTVYQYTNDEKLIAKYNSITEAAEKTGFKKGSIQATCCTGSRKTLFGYIFSYEPLLKEKKEYKKQKFVCRNQLCPLNRECQCMSEHVSTGKADCASKNKITDKPKKLSASERFKMCYEGGGYYG